jgi:hypothetical protein
MSCGGFPWPPRPICAANPETNWEPMGSEQLESLVFTTENGGSG